MTERGSTARSEAGPARAPAGGGGTVTNTSPDESPAQARAHRYARERGVSRPVYVLVRLIVAPVLRLWFRVRFTGAEHIPEQGAAILAANHKSFLDPFFVGLATRRPLRYMAKVELLRGPQGWLLLRLGAFPVRRGEADAEALQTARAILEQGELVVLFPEGTRVDEAEALGSPHHGAGRLAAETGTPIVPVAISGTSRLWLGPFPKPRRVRISFLAPVHASAEGEESFDVIDRRVWPEVQEEYGRLAATPGVIAAALAAVGIGGGLLARRRVPPAKPRLLGVVPPRKLRRRRRARLRRARGLPAAARRAAARMRGRRR